MNEWIIALGFGVCVMAFALGMASIIMGFMTSKAGAAGMQEKVEYGFFGVSGLIICLLMIYVIT